MLGVSRPDRRPIGESQMNNQYTRSWRFWAVAMLAVVAVACGRERTNPIDPNFSGNDALSPPGNVQAVGGIGRVTLQWNPVVSNDLKGYGIWRSTTATEGFQRLAGEIADYLIETSRPMADYFARHDLDVIRLHCFGMEDDRDMAHVDHRSIVDAAVAVDHPDVEALFLSCTALPAVGAVSAIEERIGKPVVTSNQAGVWAMAAHAGLLDRCSKGFGRLFETKAQTFAKVAS